VLPQREKGSEIGIGGDHDPVFVVAARENLLICGVSQATIANMNHVMAALPQPLGEDRDNALSTSSRRMG
jgi:hypothetical protein